MLKVSPEEARDLLAGANPPVLLDVREDWELDIVKIEPMLHIPMGDVRKRLDEIPNNCQLLVICHHGVRSAIACKILARNGFPDVINVTGGIDAWARALDTSMPLYT